MLLLGSLKKVQIYILQNHQEQNLEVNYTDILFLEKRQETRINRHFLLLKEGTNLQLTLNLRGKETKELQVHQEEESQEKEERKKNKLIVHSIVNAK